jgi:hypothetical protein
MACFSLLLPLFRRVLGLEHLVISVLFSTRISLDGLNDDKALLFLHRYSLS